MDYRFTYRRKKPEEHEERNEQRDESDRLKRARALGIGFSIPMMLIGGPLVGWLAGTWLDKHFNTGFWMITLVILGTVAGFKTMIDMLIRLGREQ
ncbi:AtpZ/AtpI family protein [bacterium]|nr:AtpZ/AtpI family protein [bacterium]